jgi:hypothetical protein
VESNVTLLRDPGRHHAGECIPVQNEDRGRRGGEPESRPEEPATGQRIEAVGTATGQGADSMSSAERNGRGDHSTDRHDG